MRTTDTEAIAQRLLQACNNSYAMYRDLSPGGPDWRLREEFKKILNECVRSQAKATLEEHIAKQEMPRQ